MIEAKGASAHSPTINTAVDFSHTLADVPRFAQLGPELAETTERQIGSHFISTDFLSNPATQFLLLATMERTLLIKKALQGGKINQEKAIAESLLNNDLLLLLGGVAHRFYLPNRGRISPHLKLPEEAIAEAHLEFENPQLSRALEDNLASFKTQFKANLPVNLCPEAELPYRIVALNILSKAGLHQSDTASNGSLVRNTTHFITRCGGQNFTGSAWTIPLNGTSLVAIPHDTAEACLSGQYPEKLAHEFFHTQYPLNTVGLGFLLLFAEEARAKKLSGDTRSHPDVDAFAYSLKQLTGTDIFARTVGMSPNVSYDFLVRSAHVIGTQRTLELAAILPEAYRTNNTLLPASVSQRLGNTSGILRRISSQRQADPRIASQT